MSSNETSDRAKDRISTDGKERRKKAVRVKRKSSSRAVPEDEDVVADNESTTRESTPIKRKSSVPIPEFNRRTDSPNASHVSLPYPSFSKAHSREAVGSKENLSTPSRKNVFTPDPTDLEEKKNSETEKIEKRMSTAAAINVTAPLSPPLTASEMPTESRTSAMKSRRSTAGRESTRTLSEANIRKASSSGGIRSQESSIRKVSARHIPKTDSLSSIPSRPKSDRETPSNPPVVEAYPMASSVADSESTDATPKQETRGQPAVVEDEDEASPETGSDISIRTPTPRGTPAPIPGKQFGDHSYPITQPSGLYASPIPPPPPPPPAVSLQPPRVDYLMQHGGLRQSIPKRFINAPEPNTTSVWTIGDQPDPADMVRRAQAFFGPFRDLLDGYTKVIDKNGSIAVATGYRSIARRLLDRLEAVFARDISSETCACIMCDTPDNFTLDDERGVSWGEILEYVSGRRDLPQWPPFVLNQDFLASEAQHEALESPCQTLDIDVPDEYREHYIRQSKKTKESVDRWLANQKATTTTPPEEADDDTLSFAILTHLDSRLRPTFKDLLGMTSLRPGSIKPTSDSRTQTPIYAGKTEIIEKSTLAIQRLYRLGSGPRAPEVATFLVNNQYLHNVLATIAAISDAEWDILISGRFDGFLRSGAEDAPTLQPASARMTRGSTPLASTGAPVAIDEETEIAVLADVEKEIFTGMEALEDAFESLHTAAESVRRILTERRAGLAMAAQIRRGASADILEARLGTPASIQGDGFDADHWLDDNMSELAPDDSASMISKNRIRKKRRDERRTPAPIDEMHPTTMHGSGRSDLVNGRGPSRNSFRRKH